MRIFHLIFFSALIISTNDLCAQQIKLDSLKKRLRSLDENPQSYTNDTNKVNLLNSMVWKMTNFNIALDTAMDYAKGALDISKKVKWSRGTVESYGSIGRVNWFKGEFDSAIENYLEAAALSRRAKEKKWESGSLHFIGQIYKEQGNYPIALDYFLQALKINEEIKNDYDMANNMTFIGMTYSEIEDYDNALKYYLQALKKSEAVRDKYGIAVNLESIAAIYNNQSEYKKSLDYYSRVLNMQKGNVYSMYVTFIDVANVYRNQSGSIASNQPDTAWDKSMEYYSNALKTATELDDAYSSGVIYNGIGWLYLKKNKLTEAEDALNRALKFLKQDGSPEPLRECYLDLSRLDSLKGNWKNSLQYFRLYSTINDSLFNKKKSRQLANAQVKYETGKKQAEIEVLNKDNELKSLRIAQQQKNILLIIAAAVILLLAGGGYIYYRNKKIKQEALKQISEAKLASLKSLMDKHFIFSSLHSIDTFLMNNDSAAASDYLVKYSKLIRSILEMSNQAEVSLEEEISLCRSYLDLEKIRLENSFDYDLSINGTISMEQTLFPSMLLQPLVENAVKHGIGSLREEGKKGFIKIGIAIEKDKLICSVTDNGRGLQFSGNTSATHRSYSGKGIIERVKVYNSLRKGKASFLLKDNNPGVTAVLTLPYLPKKQSVAV